MVKVIKNEVVMAARDEHQLAAFLNNGWQKKEEMVYTEIQRNDNPLDEEELPPSSDNDIPFEIKETKQYTKTDINRMNKAELQELAKDKKVENAENMSGAELKEHLLNLLGL